MSGVVELPSEIQMRLANEPFLHSDSDDINKFLWMVRISQGIWPDEIQEPSYFTPRGEYKMDASA